MEDHPGLACRAYAPVGGHRDLLAYLVRRLLENGANSSFVSVAADPDVPVEALLKRPVDIIVSADRARHPKLPLPRDLYGPERPNSRGVEFGHRAALDGLLAEVRQGAGQAYRAEPLIDGRAASGGTRPIVSPHRRNHHRGSGDGGLSRGDRPGHGGGKRRVQDLEPHGCGHAGRCAHARR
jgi:RHH-type proline utilization regulon transcriptional repressor/proline dehydrogenase/delta 1-pyrroline-5-carboxylate dehydrogenase